MKPAVQTVVLPSSHMKQLIAGIVVLLVVGIGGFLYKNMLEHPATPSGLEPVACTQEAKICPDGTSVGRTGPNCEFAACPLPNAEDKAIGLAFVIPPNYVANADAIGADESLRAVFDKPSKGPVPHTILIRRLSVPSDKSANSVILANTMLEPSGMLATAMSQFQTKIANGKTFSCITIERFEGQVHTACYHVRSGDILRFEVLEKDVDWTNPNLVIDELPEHKAFYNMLATIVVN
jgi:hypothetical protein